ncbi:MAG: phosphatidylserine decarboxylase [Verrucomicrobia bacterium]|nr:phosphatidylserine decarboxylase [Verrucomicrobiota bacterium]MBU6446971.1 phosphatidylserine decarboxylase [Verrucomicrobiota bacterium]MDE3047373.1 phosphatidylserine decarboxylase [Verrucomicrobiota bacterium]
MEIQYIERSTGAKCVEKVYGHRALSLLYGDGLFKGLFSALFLPLFAHIPLFSRVYGFLQKRSQSGKKIAPFIQTYGIDASEFASHDFRSFNDFFIRKLKPEARPIVKDPRVLAMPADGRYLVYPTFDRFVIKGQTFSLYEFLQSRADCSRYAEGSMAIVRLCPSDYHRFHFPCDGVPTKARLINGSLFSVNPMALRKRLSILAENKRMITEIDTDHFGTMLYIEIGATAVGTIRQTFLPARKVKKGEEKGYFEFGGSCIVLLFEKHRIVFDADLLRNTEQGLETRANFGESLGTAQM